MTRLVPQSLSFWLAGLAPRERFLLWVMAVVLAAAAMFLGIWKPLLSERDAELARISRYDRLTVALSRLPSAGPVAQDARPIAAILAQTAAEQGLGILRLDTPRAETATLTLQDAPFETLISWIDRLNRDAGLGVASATIRRTEVAGVVSADLSLERGAP